MAIIAFAVLYNYYIGLTRRIIFVKPAATCFKGSQRFLPPKTNKYCH